METMEEVAEVVTNREGGARTPTVIIGEGHMVLVEDIMAIMEALPDTEVVEVHQLAVVMCLSISPN